MMSFYDGQGKELEMLEDALDAGGVAWWVLELPSGAVFFSPNKIKMLGYDQDQTSQFCHYTSFTDLLHPDDSDACMQAMRDCIDGKTEVYEALYRIKGKNGKYIKMYDRGRIVARKGNDIDIAGIVVEVTDHHPVWSKMNRVKFLAKKPVKRQAFR